MPETPSSQPPHGIEQHAEPARSGFRQAAGIYGLVVTAAVLASAGGQLRTAALAVAVFFTLIVYWLAEEYAQLGETLSAGNPPTWAHVRAGLGEKWPMVSASYIPLLAMLVARLLGAASRDAAFAALVVTVVLLTYYGWSAARFAGMTGLRLVAMSSAAGALGVLMILLKITIAHLH